MKTWKVVVVVSVWLLGLGFSITLLTIDFVKTSGASYVLTSSSERKAMSFPALAVCPTVLPDIGGFGRHGNQSVIFANAAHVNTMLETPVGYAVCPRYQHFQRGGVTYTCAIFDANVRPKRHTHSSLACDVNTEHTYAFAFPRKDEGFAKELPKNLWEATTVASTVVLNFEVIDTLNPAMVSSAQLLPFSDASVVQLPSTDSGFSKVFSVATQESATLPTKTAQWVSLSQLRVQRAKSEDDLLGSISPESKCDKDRFDFQAGYLQSITCSDGLPCFNVIVAFRALQITHSCTKLVYDGVDALGAFGGQIALVGFIIYLGVNAYQFWKRFQNRNGPSGVGMTLNDRLLDEFGDGY